MKKHFKISNTTLNLLLILICMIVFIFGIKVQSNNLNTAQIEKQNIELDNAKLQSKYKSLTVFGESLDKAEKTINKLLLRVPIGLNQNGIIDDLYDKAGLANITLAAISFGQNKHILPGVSKVAMTSSFSGNYVDLVSYLEALERNNRLFQVESISVQIDNLQKTNFSLNINSFYQANNNEK